MTSYKGNQEVNLVKLLMLTLNLNVNLFVDHFREKWEYLCSLESLPVLAKSKTRLPRKPCPGAPWLPFGVPILLISTLAAEGNNAHGKKCEESAKAELS